MTNTFEIPSSRPSYDAEELRALHRVLRSHHTAEGTEVRRFETRVADYLDLSRAVAASSGSASIHLVLEALGIGAGNEVVLPSYVCQSVLNPIIHTGARPVLADVDPDSFALTPETVEPVLGSRTALLLLVHPFGYPVDQPDLFGLGVPVLEDIAQAVGAETADGPVGRRGVACVGSLYATKQIAAGYGGFIASDDPDLMRSIRDLKQYDERDAYRPSYNYSFSDLNAAVANVQLRKLPGHIRRQRTIARQYEECLSSRPGAVPPQRPPGHVCYRYVIRCRDALSVQQRFQGRGIEVKPPVYKPLHHDFPQGDFPVAETLHREALLLPNWPGMSEDHVKRVQNLLEEWFPRGTLESTEKPPTVERDTPDI